MYRMALPVVATLVLFALAPLAHAGSVSWQYGPVEGYSFQMPLPSDSFQVTVTDVLPSSTYVRICIITEYEDGRPDSDRTCGETAECRTGIGPCDDVPDAWTAGCGSHAVTSPLPAGGQLLEIGVKPVHVETASGNLCLGLRGTITLTWQ